MTSTEGRMYVSTHDDIDGRMDLRKYKWTDGQMDEMMTAIECYARMLLDYWALSKNEGSIALAIGQLGLAKLNRSMANCILLLSIALLG